MSNKKPEYRTLEGEEAKSFIIALQGRVPHGQNEYYDRLYDEFRNTGKVTLPTRAGVMRRASGLLAMTDQIKAMLRDRQEPPSDSLDSNF